LESSIHLQRLSKLFDLWSLLSLEDEVCWYAHLAVLDRKMSFPQTLQMNLVEIFVFETGVDSVTSSDMTFSCFNGRFLRLFSLLLVTLARELSPSIPFAALNLLFFILPDLSERVCFPVVLLFFFLSFQH